MVNIFQNLRDPGWWFTTVFIAILASIVAGFLKDKIEQALSLLSLRFKKWRQTQVEKREVHVVALASNTHYLTFAYLRAIVGLLLYFMILVMYLVTPLVMESAPSSIEALVFDRKFVIWKILMPLLGIVGGYVGFTASSRLSLVMHAFKRFREQNGLPKLP